METGFLFRGSNLRVGCQQSGCSKKHYVHCEKSMSIVYLVRKKVFRTAEGVKQLLLCCAACVTAAWRCDGRAAGAAYGIQKRDEFGRRAECIDRFAEVYRGSADGGRVGDH